MESQRKRNPDRRIQRTRSLLHEALVGLLHENAYDEIAVQDILNLANVGRSTFYMHFRDKDDLLVSGIETSSIGFARCDFRLSKSGMRSWCGSACRSMSTLISIGRPTN